MVQKSSFNTFWTTLELRSSNLNRQLLFPLHVSDDMMHVSSWQSNSSSLQPATGQSHTSGYRCRYREFELGTDIQTFLERWTCPPLQEKPPYTTNGLCCHVPSVEQHRGRGGSVVRIITSHQGEPVESLPNFHMWELCRMIPLAGGFPQGSPVSPSFAFRPCFILASLHPHRFSMTKPIYSFVKYTEIVHVFQVQLVPSNPRSFPSPGGRGGLVVRLHATHHGEPVTISCGTAPLIFERGNCTGRRRWLAGFLRDLPFPQTLHYGAAPSLHRFTLIGSKNLDVESRSNLFPQSPTHSERCTAIRLSLLAFHPYSRNELEASQSLGATLMVPVRGLPDHEENKTTLEKVSQKVVEKGVGVRKRRRSRGSQPALSLSLSLSLSLGPFRGDKSSFHKFGPGPTFFLLMMGGWGEVFFPNLGSRSSPPPLAPLLIDEAFDFLPAQSVPGASQFVTALRRHVLTTGSACRCYIRRWMRKYGAEVGRCLIETSSSPPALTAFTSRLVFLVDGCRGRPDEADMRRCIRSMPDSSVERGSQGPTSIKHVNNYTALNVTLKQTLNSPMASKKKCEASPGRRLYLKALQSAGYHPETTYLNEKLSPLLHLTGSRQHIELTPGDENLS
ncbi:hypothetical protein PR048_030822 [Dryococelus australis]|uniref:Uncharacterized protein n=1 Tax=Dryococelus australis TaxID=614101 RepID=A0ABQ9GA00_9NEOP|nr:hypothetical protein PR048_030822 [Dryococelus australis]